MIKTISPTLRLEAAATIKRIKRSSILLGSGSLHTGLGRVVGADLHGPVAA